jgi:manganese/iron transport system permease protein/iron/zinc/copper transport system permease protein
VFVVLRASYIGHGMSHSVFGGAVVGYVAGVNFTSPAWGFLSNLSTRRPAGVKSVPTLPSGSPWQLRLGRGVISRATHVTRPSTALQTWWAKQFDL